MAEVEDYYLRLRTQVSHHTPSVECTVPPDHIQQGDDDPWCPDPDSCKEIYFYRTANQEIAEKLIRLFETRYADHFRTSGSERFDGYFHVVPASELGEAERFLLNEEVDRIGSIVGRYCTQWTAGEFEFDDEPWNYHPSDPPLYDANKPLCPESLHHQAMKWERKLSPAPDASAAETQTSNCLAQNSPVLHPENTAADGSEAAETGNEERIACSSRPVAQTRIESLRAACRDLLEQLRSIQRASGENPKTDWPSVSRAYRALKIHTGVCGEEGLIRGIEPLMENAERCAGSLVERRDYRRRLKRASPDQVEYTNHTYHASDLMDPEVWDEFTGQVDVAFTHYGCHTDYGKWWEEESGRVDDEISSLEDPLGRAIDDLVLYLETWLLPQTDKALSDEPLPAKSKPFPGFDAVQDGGSGKDPAVEPGKAGGAGESHTGMTRDILPDVSKFAHAIRHTLVLASDAKLLDRFRQDRGDGISEFWAGVRLDEYHFEAEDEAAQDDRSLAFQRLADQSGKYIIDTPHMHFDNDVPPGLWAEVHRAKSSGSFARYWVLLLHVLGWRESRATRYLCEREWLEGATMEDERYCFKSSIPDVVSATTETILLAVANQARFKLECLCTTHTRDPAEWRALFNLSDPTKKLAFREDLPVREHAITASIYELVDGLANLTTDLCQQCPSTDLTCGEDTVTYEEIIENQGGHLAEIAQSLWCHPDFGPQHADDLKQKFRGIEATAQQYPARLDKIMADYRRDANRALMIYLKEFAGNLKPLYEEIEKQGGLDGGMFELSLPGVRREPKTIKAIAAEIRAAYTGNKHKDQSCQSSFREEVLRFIELLVQLNNTVVRSCSQEAPMTQTPGKDPTAKPKKAGRATDAAGSVKIPMPASECYGELCSGGRQTLYLRIMGARPGEPGKRPELARIPLTHQPYRILEAGIQAAMENHRRTVKETARLSGISPASECDPPLNHKFDVEWTQDDLAGILYDGSRYAEMDQGQKGAIKKAASTLRTLVVFSDEQKLLTNADKAPGGRRRMTIPLRFNH